LYLTKILCNGRTLVMNQSHLPRYHSDEKNDLEKEHLLKSTDNEKKGVVFWFGTNIFTSISIVVINKW
jgi:hypothetical protein